jgi:hypothetical protein
MHFVPDTSGGFQRSRSLSITTFSTPQSIVKLVGTDTDSDVATATGGISAKIDDYPELDRSVTIKNVEFYRQPLNR